MSRNMTDQDDIDIDFEPAPPDKLYAHNCRQLSAMLDGELSPDQARFMLRRLQHDGELAACWERWQVCGDILRGRGHALLPADFSKRVAAAIAAPEAATATPAAGQASVRPRPHRLLRWGGGALAASVALVALFMARQMPDPQAPELAEAASPARSAPAVVRAAPPVVALADADDAVPALPAPGEPVEGGAPDAAGLLAAAAPVAVAVAEVPRRAAARNSTRSQSQRAAARRSQAAADAAPLRAVAAAPQPPAVVAMPQASMPAVADPGVSALAGLPAATTADGDALFGAPPSASPRPWPRAVLPGFPAGGQPFAAGYGLQQAEAFAPFQPRMDMDIAAPAAAAAAADVPALPPVDEGVDASAPGRQVDPGSTE